MMMLTKSRGKRTRARLRISLFQLLIGAFALSVAVAAYGQTISGRWAASGQTLTNGEKQLSILDLKQSGSALTGTLKTLGYSVDITGTVNGSQFKLFAPFRSNKPFLVGSLVNGELHLTRSNGQQLVAKPATPSQHLPVVTYIQPPPLRAVPYNGLAKTPPMGWNSWNLFAGKIDDQTVRAIADAMVSSGKRDAGYIYINIDDTWEGVRDAQGNLRPNYKFPDMKALAAYVHSKGLKLGIYSSPGPRTCAGYPGSYGHAEQDAKTFASWGIDYLKYDWCSAGMVYNNSQLQPVYQEMGRALESTGRPIVFSLCEYGLGDVQKWGPAVGGNLWRTTGDIRDEWSSMMGNIEKQVPLAPDAGPGHWNDPDMLEIGNGHMTDNEYRTHMSLWALSTAPLLLGNDIRTMSAATKAILMNREVIAIDQDSLGKQAVPVTNGQFQTWIKPLSDGSVAIGVVNLGTAAGRATITASELHLKGSVVKARDLWIQRNVKFIHGVYTATVSPHGVLLIKAGAR
jgi:alpha-galactosidase